MPSGVVVVEPVGYGEVGSVKAFLGGRPKGKCAGMVSDLGGEAVGGAKPRAEHGDEDPVH